MAWSKFKAIPNYLGGKRKLVPEIFKHFPPATEAPVFVDAFLGGGSVSLFAKAKGYKVICNDLAYRSITVGQALITNSSHKIIHEDVLRLVTEVETDNFTVKTYAPRVFPTKVARHIDIMRTNIASFPEHKQPLMTLLLIKYILSTRPFGHFSGAIRHVQRIESGDKEAAMSERHYARQNQKLIHHPIEVLLKLAEDVNKGIFDNGSQNEVHQGDVFEFIKNVKADCVYFDPPYSESTSYEECYAVLDNVLAGQVLPVEPSVFSKKDALEFHDKLYASSKHIPHIVISMGCINSKKGISGEELLQVVKKHRPKAQMKRLEHKWTINNTASTQAKAENQEYIIYA